MVPWSLLTGGPTGLLYDGRSRQPTWTWLPVRGVRVVTHAGVPLSLDRRRDHVVTISTCRNKTTHVRRIGARLAILSRASIAIAQTNVRYREQYADNMRDRSMRDQCFRRVTTDRDRESVRRLAVGASCPKGWGWGCSARVIWSKRFQFFRGRCCADVRYAEQLT